MSDRADRAIIITSCAAIAACSGFILLGNPGVVETEEVRPNSTLLQPYNFNCVINSIISSMQAGKGPFQVYRVPALTPLTPHLSRCWLWVCHRAS